MFGDSERHAVLSAGGVAVVVAAMGNQADDVTVQRHGCDAMWSIAAGNEACKQAVLDAGGVAAVVAAMEGYANDLEVQQCGCGALRSIAAGDAACKQALLRAGGLAALKTAGTAHFSCKATVRAAEEHLGELGIDVTSSTSYA